MHFRTSKQDSFLTDFTHLRTIRIVAVVFTVALGMSAVTAVTAPGEQVTVRTAAQQASAPSKQLPRLGKSAQEEKDLQDGTTLAPWELKDGVKVFTLTTAPLKWQAKPGGPVIDAMAINGHVPAPTIQLEEGDKARFVIRNEMPESTSIHWHGMDLENDQDGVPHLTQEPIEPGQSFTYEWTAISTGTHWYHSHMHGDQEGAGLYGSLEVTPRLGDIPSDRDYRIIIGDGPLGFVFNGKSFPATRALRAKVGERVRIRLINSGPNNVHSIHLHSGFFSQVAQDGRNAPVPVEMDTINVGVGQTFDLIWKPTRPGKWMIHCHIFSHSETKHGMTGMVSIFTVDPPTVKLPKLPIIGD